MAERSGFVRRKGFVWDQSTLAQLEALGLASAESAPGLPHVELEPSLAAERNLILVHRKGCQDFADFVEIRDHIIEYAPDIEVFIADAESRCSVTRRRAAQRPTLVFSPTMIEIFRPARGKIYQGRPMPKIEQVERLAAAGLPVPKTTLLRPDTKLDPAEWGEYVVLKPSLPEFQSMGQGVSLTCTEDVRYIPPEDYPEDHPGRHSPMVAQSYVHTGAAISNIRVLTLFGEPLYALQNWSKVETIELTPEKVRRQNPIVAHQSIPPEQKTASFIDDEDVLALARAAYAACPEAALQACDILRDCQTGRLYVIEFNPGGNTWHFSSSRAQMIREGLEASDAERFAQERRSQFDAFETAARVLAERARREAI